MVIFSGTVSPRASAASGASGGVDARIGRRGEALDVDPVQRDAQLEQRALDGRHEGARAAQVELGVERAADQPLDARAVEEAVAHVERVHDLERSGCCARERLELVLEDDRALVAVRVDELRRRRRLVASADFRIEITGVMPLPPLKSTISRDRRVQHEESGGRRHHQAVAGPDVIVDPVRDAAVLDALDRDLVLGVAVRRARQRVAARQHRAPDTGS